jgi:hypothetical protein
VLVGSVGFHYNILECFFVHVEILALMQNRSALRLKVRHLFVEVALEHCITDIVRELRNLRA